MKQKTQFDALITCQDGSKFAFIAGQVERLRYDKVAIPFSEHISLLSTIKGKAVLWIDATTWDLAKRALFQFASQRWPKATVCYNGGSEFYLDS